MPKYFFDVTDAGKLTRDELGETLADDDEARDQAISLLPDIAREEMPDGDQHEISVAVRGEDDENVYEASLTLHGRWSPGRK